MLVDGKPLESKVPPAIEQGRVLVPARVISQVLGALLEWDGATRTVTITREQVTVRTAIGARAAYRNGVPVALDVPARIVNGRALVPLRFVSESLGTGVFWDGQTATVLTGTPEVSGVPEERELFPVRVDGALGYIDGTGKIVIKPQFSNGCAFSEGLARVWIGRKQGYIDKTGRVVIGPQFDDAQDFSEGLAAVLVASPGNPSGKWVYIDRTGRVVIDRDDIIVPGNFSEGLAPVKVGCGSGNLWGYIDKNGNMVIGPRFESAGGFHSGLAEVGVDLVHGGRWRYIDNTGKHVWYPSK
ncbi:WG repeat-containing protein [Thermodesulfitimonas sp.]